MTLKKFNLSKLIIIALIIIIVALSAIVVSAKKFKTAQNPAAMTQTINDGTGFVDQVIAAPIHFVQDKANELSDLMNTYKQNESLKKQLSDLSDEKNKLAGAESENKELKKALNLQETLTDYQTVSANVITRNPASWNDTLVIDRGTKDKLKKDMIVMANGGIIGRITQVNKTTAKVSLLISTKGIENKIPVRLGSSGDPTYGLLSSYDSQQNAFIVTQVNTSTKFAKGSQVFTSGLGGNGAGSVRDLLVGSVIGEKLTNQGLDRQIYIKPASSLYDIRFVTVIERMNGGN